MENFAKVTLAGLPREELHDKLGLTGCETSVNTLPAGASIPFVHSHKANEELYGVLAGKGEFSVDGQVIPVAAGDWLRISPAGRRCVRAASDSSLTYICVQTRAGSLEGYTMTDGVILQDKAPWQK